MNRFEKFNDEELELMYCALSYQYRYSSMAGRDEIKFLAHDILREQEKRRIATK